VLEAFGSRKFKNFLLGRGPSPPPVPHPFLPLPAKIPMGAHD